MAIERFNRAHPDKRIVNGKMVFINNDGSYIEEEKKIGFFENIRAKARERFNKAHPGFHIVGGKIVPITNDNIENIDGNNDAENVTSEINPPVLNYWNNQWSL